MNDKTPIYNSRVMKVFMEYVVRNHPDVDTSSFLEYAGMTRHEVEDQAHWFTQNQADRFHEILVSKTGNPNIAREAGRFAASAEGLGPARQYALGFLSPLSAYLLMEKLYPTFSRGAVVKAKKLRSNKVEIVSTPRPGVAEKPYQCENRMGFFETLARLFTERIAKIEHPQCLHKGDDGCHYIITWKKTPPLAFKRLRNYSFLLGILGSFSLFFVLPVMAFALFALLCTLLVVTLSFCYKHFENRELKKTIETQGDAARDHMNEIEIRYSNALLVQEIGKATSTILDVEKLMNSVADVMEEHLDFDRGMIMLADEENTRLLYAAGYGYHGDEEALRLTEFRLDNPESKGAFVLAFKEQIPFLVNDIAEIEGALSERSREFIRQMRVQSFICVPIIYETESLGIIAVDNIESRRTFTQSDVSLLMGIASEIAVGIINARSIDQVRKSEERYRTILENIEEGYYEVDLAGNLTFFNETLYKILGYPADELQGVNYRRLMDRETARNLYRVFNRVHNILKPEIGFGCELRTRDGLKIFVEISVSTIVDSNAQQIGFRGTLRDVTKKKKTEAELIETKNFLQNVLDSSVVGITTTDLKGKVIYTTPNAKGIIGYEQEEIIGKDVYLLYENGREDAKTIMKKLMAKGEMRDWEIRLRRKDGGLLDISLSASLLRDEAGDVIGTLGIYRDISEKKRLETQLQHAQKMEAIGTLAGGVAHDLNNILSGLVSYPDLLLVGIPDDSPFKKPILTIKNSGVKAAAIVQDLLTLARRGVVVSEVVNPNHVISQYLKSPEYEKLRSLHPGVEVEAHLESHLFNILGSPIHLSKTIMNLLSNAAEAMPYGGRIIVSTENRYIDRPIKGYDDVREGDYVVLTVSDTGTGISPRDIRMIFEPFYTKKQMGRSGTGLGMTVVWGTVKDHNGYIDVQSTEGTGTTFILYFPVTRQDVAKDRSRIPMEDYMSKGESILVIDDVGEQRQIASGMLKELGYSVASVSSGEEAVEYLKANSAELLVLDMIMPPGMDGLETYKNILKKHPGQKAIIASGYSETERVKEAQRLGAGAYIKKPFLLRKIGVAVRNELDK